ncbi:hypothetical protein [Reyranella sp. CPCC 100927]|uniref:hypothetical protein n=1 Tax=Reyranella sp. CPCC 100927 TaxID=2599616 RepID=UPI0011B7EBED|nr:hypothetical protein [Reyranella sp. CPCC 100927]TWS94982.1 hypothetical protein FQU96_40755 [Reyranella sp. CPCC 100927]
MTKKPKAKRSPRSLRSIIPSVTYEELGFANHLLHAAYVGTAPTKPLPDPEPGYLTLKDIPLNRAAMALLDAFKDDPDKGHALLARCTTLMGYWRRPEAARWVRTRDGGEEVHPALAKATAEVPFHFMEDEEEIPKRLFELAAKIEKEWDEAEGKETGTR